MRCVYSPTCILVEYNGRNLFAFLFLFRSNGFMRLREGLDVRCHTQEVESERNMDGPIHQS
jgi:hypothetical protein